MKKSEKINQKDEREISNKGTTQFTENQQSVNQTEKDLRKPEPPRFQVQFDMSYGGTYVTKDGESMTVPDMNLTVRQLLINHSRGLSNDRHLKDPLYFDIRIPKIKDITDVHEYKQYLEGQVKEVETWLKNEKEEKLEQEKQQLNKLKEAKNKQLRIDDEAEGKD